MVGPILHSILAPIHVLSGAAWFGAMFYSWLVLHPRAQGYFSRPTEFEAFIATVSQGARYSVLTALSLMGITGLGLVLLRWPEIHSMTWLILIAAKTVLFLTALGLFVFVSWRLWPARILALENEISHFQKLSRRLAQVMLTIAGLSISLGVFAHIWCVGL
jgi:uncharacterized membrane protein